MGQQDGYHRIRRSARQNRQTSAAETTAQGLRPPLMQPTHHREVGILWCAPLGAIVDAGRDCKAWAPRRRRRRPPLLRTLQPGCCTPLLERCRAVQARLHARSGPLGRSGLRGCSAERAGEGGLHFQAERGSAATQGMPTQQGAGLSGVCMGIGVGHWVGWAPLRPLLICIVAPLSGSPAQPNLHPAARPEPARMSSCAAVSQVAALRGPARPSRSSRRSCAARCAQQDPLLLRVARGEGGRRAAAAGARWRRSAAVAAVCR